MQKLKNKTLTGLLVAFLCLSWAASAQVAVNSVVAEDQVHFAKNTDFEIGTLTIKIKLPPAKTTAKVTVTLPTGIEYVPGSVVLGANATSATQVAGSPAGAPVFTLIGTPNTEVVFTIKRKLTKAATTAVAGAYLTDKVKAEVNGEPSDEGDSNKYRVVPPVVTIENFTGVFVAQVGVNTTTFGIRNTGVGHTRDIYFSVDYPANVTNVNFIPPTGVTVTHVGNVPTGWHNAGKPLYRLTKTANFQNNELVTVTQVYKVAASLCGGQTKIGYVPYWGLSATELFGQNTKVDRSVNVRTYTPLVKQTDDNNKRYFKYEDGLCAAAGQKLGTFYTAFKNESTDATAYNNRLSQLSQWLTYFSITNFCIIAADGTKIPVAETSNNNAATTVFDFPTNAALLTTNPALASKNIGFTDEDGDGYMDDLKPGAEVRICYDLVSKGKPFACNTLSVNPSYYYYYDSACGSTTELRVTQNTYVRAFNHINRSSVPAQLLLNTPERGYLAPGMTSVAAYEQLQGQPIKDNNLRYHYYMKLPAGVGLKNIKFYYTTDNDVTNTTAPNVSIADVAAGGVLSWTTPEVPPTGITGNGVRWWGYISYDMELTNCAGASNSNTISYTISLMSRNQDGTTFCAIPIVCESVKVSLGCSSPCLVNGPEMLSTKVERADNSYGWTDATMTTRVQRANVSPEQRRKVLQLDDVEFFAEGKQSTAVGADNLFYYAAVRKQVNLVPKSIKVTIGSQVTTLQATDLGAVATATDATGNYYRWNLTNALPTTGLAAGQTFSVVATYQVNNTVQNSYLEQQSGIISYFYTLADKTDTAISPKGYHTNRLRCGAELVPIFNFGDTEIRYGTNSFNISACTPGNIGTNVIYSGRFQGAGSSIYTQEYRPGRLIKKIVLKMPLAYKITANTEYRYTANAADTKKSTENRTLVTVPLSKWVETTEGNYRKYTYTNPVSTDPYYLPPGMINAGDYTEWLRVKVQGSCKSRDYKRDIVPGREATNAEILAAGEVINFDTEYEDYYYHYAQQPTSLPTENKGERPVFYTNKPQLFLTAQGAGTTIRANRNEQSTVFSIETRYSAAPNAWISIPDITGVEIQGLEEVNNATGASVLHTFTPVTSISGEKMYFLNQTLPVGATSKKYYRLKFKLTNCSQPQLKLKVYAGWNCDGNPTGGYRSTCDDTFLEYTVNIAKSKKEIEVGSSPTSLPMCTKTPYSYIVKSTDEGDIFGAKLVVVKQPGIIISDVQVEYPLGSGTLYNTTTPVLGKQISENTVGNKTTYNLADILPGGSLPGSVSTSTENSQKFKVLFNVQPECNFISGSSFDIDLEGNNLCGIPAIGPKIVAIVAGVQSATVNNYNMLLSSINYVSGNANACDNGATYKVRVAVNTTPPNPAFVIGNDARLHIRFPESYEIQNSDI